MAEGFNTANKPTAIELKDRGKQFLLSGDYARAIKFFEKSMKLYPIAGVPEMKARAEREWGEQQRKASHPKPSPVNRRAPTGSVNGSAGASASQVELSACLSALTSSRRVHPPGALAH